MRLLPVVLFSAVAFAQTPPDSLLPRIREVALRFQGQLPDFSCVQITDRSRDDSGSDVKWKHQDTIEESLSYLGGRISFKVLKVDGKPPGKFAAFGHSGLGSEGVFNAALIPRHIFGPRLGARFERLREETQNGARVFIYSYSVNPFYPLKHGSKTISGGFHGTFVADAESAMILSRHQEMDTPEDPAYPKYFNDIEYGPVRLSDRELFLPVRIVETVHDGRRLMRNDARFENCRKYSADSTLTFDQPN